MKQRLLKISQIKRRDEFYPRNGVNWVTTIRYSNALKTGAVFPPITVAKVKRTYILIDGAHRVESNKINGETHITANILENLNEKEMFIEAVRLNTSHGLQYSAQETAKIMLKLKSLKVTKEEISELVRIPIDKVEPFIAKRMIRIIGSRGGEKGIEILKKEIKHLAGTDSMEIDQNRFIGVSQVKMIDALINLIQKDLINWDNKLVARKIKKLTKLLNELL